MLTWRTIYNSLTFSQAHPKTTKIIVFLRKKKAKIAPLIIFLLCFFFSVTLTACLLHLSIFHPSSNSNLNSKSACSSRLRDTNPNLSQMATTMVTLIGLVNRIQRACTVLGDYGGDTASSSLPTLWESLPSVVVVGGQVLLLPFSFFFLVLRSCFFCWFRLSVPI